MIWEILMFAVLALLGVAGIGLGLISLHKIDKKNDTHELVDAIKQLEARPICDPSQIKDLLNRVNKLDDVTTKQGQLLALVKKSAFQAEEMSKKLAAVHNQTATNKI